MKRNCFKKFLPALIFITLLSGSFVLFSHTTFAQQDPSYKLLAPLPGIGEKGQEVSLSTYVPQLFKLLIGLAVAFVLINIVVGGFQYMSSDAFQNKQDGKARIWNAIKGLVLVAGAWLILYTINPDLLNFNLNIKAVQIDGTVGGTLTPLPGEGPSQPSGTGSYCFNCKATNQSGLNMSPNVTNWCSTTSEGCFINATLMGKLQGLNGQTSGLVITEVWPASRHHQNPCHQNGTCVDAVIGNMTNVENVKNFINSSINNGLKPVFETSDQNLIDQLIRAGVSSSNLDNIRQCNNEIKTACITGPHFSLYN